MRAAHSIKGASRIVGLTGCVTLAHAMEDLLTGVQNGKFILSAGDIDLLLQSNDIFKKVSDLNTSSIPGYVEQQITEITDLSKSLRDSAAAKTSSGNIARKSVSAFAESIEESRLDAFRGDVEQYVGIIERGLADIENSQIPIDAGSLIKAAQSIKTNARNLGLSLEVSLAQAIEDVFTNFDKGTLILKAEVVDVLFRSNDFFSKFISFENSEIPGWLMEQSASIKGLTASLNDFMAGRTASAVIEKADVPVELSDRKELIHKEESYVRVMTEKLNRMIGFTGECLVRTKSAKIITSRLYLLKNDLMELNSLMESMLLSSDYLSLSLENQTSVNNSLHNLDKFRDAFYQHIEDFEVFFQQAGNESGKSL